jgi:hypothetical protein
MTVAYLVTPVLGLQNADPATIQSFETTVVNGNMNAIDTAIGTDRGRLTNLETAILKAVADLDALIVNSATTFRGKIIHVNSLNANFQAQNSVWVQVTPAMNVATTVVRDTEYAKATGQFKVVGARVMLVDGTEYAWKNAAWQLQPWAVAAGTAFYSGAGGSSAAPLFWDGGVVITFPVGRFTQPPIVTVGGANAGGAVVWPWVSVAATTTTVTIAGLRVGATPLSTQSFNWEAVQMSPAAAAG